MPFSVSLIGFLGVLLIALSWIPQTIRVLREKKSGSDIRFLLVYSLGSFLLLAYSILIRDAVYIVLNMITSALAAVNLYYAVNEKKKK